MPPRSAALALEQLREENPQLAEHVHLGGGSTGLPPTPRPPAAAPAHRDHSWKYRDFDSPSGTARFQCAVCSVWMTRSVDGQRHSISYYLSDGITKVSTRPACDSATVEVCHDR